MPSNRQASHSNPLLMAGVRTGAQDAFSNLEGHSIQLAPYIAYSAYLLICIGSGDKHILCLVSLVLGFITRMELVCAVQHNIGGTSSARLVVGILAQTRNAEFLLHADLKTWRQRANRERKGNYAMG